MKPISLPIALRIANQPVVLVGEGEGAIAKSRLLTARDAQVRYAGDEPSLVAQFGQHALTPDIMVGARACFVASELESTVTQGVAMARAAGVSLNVMDRPELCEFTVPAIVERGPVQVSIATDGASPVLARLLRTRIESWLPQGFVRLVELASRWQDRVRQGTANLSDRRRLWERALTGAIANQAMAGDDAGADSAMQALVDGQALGSGQAAGSGEVYLVGAGPGDAELLTLKGLRLLQQADVVLYDALVSQDVLDLARRDAVLEDVGKRRGHCPTPQSAIIERMLQWARQGKRVCRLKGGDPYLFGRGGEEALALVDAQIPFQTVPGITSAAGISAQAGIPLTHRGIARSVRFVTGHLANGSLPADWQRLVDQQETLVLYMALHHLPAIQASLLKAGVAPNTPVALIQNGARANQRVWVSQVDACTDAAREINPEDGPTLVMVGQVVSLREQLGVDRSLANALADPTGQSWMLSA